MTILHIEPRSFFGSFHIHSFKKWLNNQMADLILQVIPSLFAKFSKNSLFNSAKKYKNYIVSKDYCIAHQDAEMCFLPNCKYHILLSISIEDLLQKLFPLYFTYRHVGCLYTLFKHQFSGNFDCKSIKRLIMRKEQSILFIGTEEWTECPASRKTDPWAWSTESNYWAPSERQNQRKPIDQSM